MARTTAALVARRRRGGIDRGRQAAGWLFVSPVVLGLLVFLVAPILLAVWVSVSDWAGRGSPLAGGVGFVGTENYSRLLAEEGLVRRDFMTAIRNTVFYVLLVVPLQTVLALLLATVLNQQRLRARGFFRTAFYFPTVTSSVAISLVFIFLFTGNGAVNAVIDRLGGDGPNWFADPRGVGHLLGDALGLWEIASPPESLTGTPLLGLAAWDWLSGPSVALSAIIMLVVWTTTGLFMLMFLAALQDVPVEVEEAAVVDGANRWQRFRAVTLPHLRPTILLVVTLGLIGTWQVFDQMFVITQGGPAKTTLSPAYLSYAYAFENGQWGVATAMAFVLFAIIFAFTLLQRWLFRDRDAARERRARRLLRRRLRAAERAGGGSAAGGGSTVGSGSTAGGAR